MWTLTIYIPTNEVGNREYLIVRPTRTMLTEDCHALRETFPDDHSWCLRDSSGIVDSAGPDASKCYDPSAGNFSVVDVSFYLKYA